MLSPFQGFSYNYVQPVIGPNAEAWVLKCSVHYDELAFENERYWNAYPKWAQIRFYSYAQTSGKPIVDKQILEDKKREIETNYKEEQTLPMSEYYCGVFVRPKRVVFYAYRLDELSDVCEYHQVAGSWVKSLLSP